MFCSIMWDARIVKPQKIHFQFLCLFVGLFSASTQVVFKGLPELFLWGNGNCWGIHTKPVLAGDDLKVTVQYPISISLYFPQSHAKVSQSHAKLYVYPPCFA